MARPKNVLGLKAVKMGAVGADGGMGTVLTEILGATVKGTASLVLNEGSYTEIEIEEEDVAYDELTTQAPKWAFTLESYNMSGKALSEMGAGDLEPGTAGAPDSIGMDVPIDQEMSIECETKNGAKLQIARMLVRIRPQFDLMKEQFGKVIVTGTPLKPTKAGLKTVVKTDAPA
ncbi:hypothetical protein [Sphingobacterium yanglingense]|uniref:Uncharacterized protein n=1 Tax=Sphingobacterium yanglingense TaxID=1437280 RepID=A0A4R6WSB1_9SPHI|nr:hypothetical protein [Sphingobacterium yanglingense]TDQ79586.1 hypothetical protein CLV99_1031 [Sphingobacterium yanglingense]